MENTTLDNIKGTLFILAMLLLTTQTINLGYLKWFTERPSIQERSEEESAADKSFAIAQENLNISKMNYYCLSGLILVICGVVVSNKLNALLGLPLVIAGFCELIGYTGMLIRYPNTLYDRLMTLKFLYSASSLLLLLVVAHMINIINYNWDMQEEMEE